MGEREEEEIKRREGGEGRERDERSTKGGSDPEAGVEAGYS